MTTHDHSVPVSALFEDWARLAGINVGNRVVREERHYATPLGKLRLSLEQGDRHSFCQIQLQLCHPREHLVEHWITCFIRCESDGKCIREATTTMDPLELPDTFLALAFPWVDEVEDSLTWRCELNGDQSALLAGALCQVR